MLALEGIRVLDLSRLLPGPYCTMLLADFGAEVIKIEEPKLGDYSRTFPPFLKDFGYWHLQLNRNKKSVTLDLKSDVGRKQFLELVRTADVVVESYRPGVLKKLGVDFVSTLDIPTPDWGRGRWGACRVLEDGSTQLLASPYWNWGEFYVKLIQSILGGGWDALNSTPNGEQAVNYWWGMASGVIGVQLDDALPEGVATLVQILQRGITEGTITPFHRPLTDQSGAVRNDGGKWFTPEEILNMDWLCDAVDGSIPEYDQLLPRSRGIVRLQGVYRDRIPPEKEGVLL